MIKKGRAFVVAFKIWLDGDPIVKAYDAYVFAHASQTTGARRARGKLHNPK